MVDRDQGMLAFLGVAADPRLLDEDLFNLPDAESSSNNTSSSKTTANTADIAKETLIDRESHDGTLGHGGTTTLSSKGSGTVTWLPTTGATVSRGKACPATTSSGVRPVAL